MVPNHDVAGSSPVCGSSGFVCVVPHMNHSFSIFADSRERPPPGLENLGLSGWEAHTDVQLQAQQTAAGSNPVPLSSPKGAITQNPRERRRVHALSCGTMGTDYLVALLFGGRNRGYTAHL